jgi:peptidoglycan/LPS O-acetylase OafA/YrhL
MCESLPSSVRSGRIIALDGLRAIAVVLVVAGHGFDAYAPDQARAQGPLEVCPSSPGGTSGAAVCWSGLAFRRWSRRSRTLLLQPI